jgi:endoglucanase
VAPTAVPSATAVANPAATATSPAKPDPLAGLNYLHTDGAKILDSANNEVLLAGVNWFGLETDTLAPHGIWARNYEEMLDQIVQLGYNCIRLPFSNELFDSTLTPNGIDVYKNPDLKGLNGLQIMDKIVVGAGKRGLKIILDQHRPTTDSQSPLWWTSELSQEDWIENWRALAQRYLGNDAVIGADLHNEPSGDATWGSGDPQTDWPTAAEACAKEIQKINPHWLIVVEGIEKSQDSFGNVMDWTWQGGELIGARFRQIKLDVPNQLVYSPHDYGPSVYQQGWFDDPKFPANLPAFWDFHWGYIHKQGIAPILVGEFGGTSVGTDPEGQWQRAIVNYLKTNGIHYTYWALNANSADTGGLLAPDWTTVNQDKQDLLKTHQGKLLGNKAGEVVDTSAVPRPSSTRLPTKALHFDATNVQWTNLLKPELYVANKTLQPMDLSKVELRYWFAPNGNDDPKAYSVQIGGTSTKDFGKVLSGDAVKTDIVSDGTLNFAGNPLWHVRVSFAPGTVAPVRDSIGFGLTIKRNDGGQFFQPSHYSYRDYHWPSEWNRIGLYQDGKLVWGVEPKTYLETQAAKEDAIDAQRAKFLGG